MIDQSLLWCPLSRSDHVDVVRLDAEWAARHFAQLTQRDRGRVGPMPEAGLTANVSFWGVSYHSG